MGAHANSTRAGLHDITRAQYSMRLAHESFELCKQTCNKIYTRDLPSAHEKLLLSELADLPDPGSKILGAIAVIEL